MGKKESLKHFSGEVDVFHLLEHLLKMSEHNPDINNVKAPINAVESLLAQTAARAIEVDDPQLNILMLELCLYDVDLSEIQNEINKQKKRISKFIPKKHTNTDGENIASSVVYSITFSDLVNTKNNNEFNQKLYILLEELIPDNITMVVKPEFFIPRLGRDILHSIFWYCREKNAMTFSKINEILSLNDKALFELFSEYPSCQLGKQQLKIGEDHDGERILTRTLLGVHNILKNNEKYFTENQNN